MAASDSAKWAAGLASATFLSLVALRVCLEYTRRSNLRKKIKSLRERISDMRNAAKELDEKIAVEEKIYKKRKPSSPSSEISTEERLLIVLKSIQNISPVRARLLLRKAIVVNILRGYLWQKALGGGFATKEQLDKLIAKNEGTKEEEKYLRTIRNDLCRTFPSTEGFERGGKFLPRLQRVLRAYASSDDEIKYVQGMNSVAGMACMVADSDEQAFYITSQLMRNPYLGHRDMFKSGGMFGFPLACKLGWMLDQLMAKYYPKLAKHAKIPNELRLMGTFGIFSGVNVAHMTLKWFLTLFASIFPSDIALRIYDSFIADGHIVLLRVAMLSIREREDAWLSLPEGDTKMLQAKRWHYILRQEIDGDETGPVLRAFWRNQKPKDIMVLVENMPPSAREFVQLQKRYMKEKNLKTSS